MILQICGRAWGSRELIGNFFEIALLARAMTAFFLPLNTRKKPSASFSVPFRVLRGFIPVYS